MKNFNLAFLLAFLVVLTTVTIRRSVSGVTTCPAPLGHDCHRHEPGTTATDGNSCNWHESGPAAADGNSCNRHEPGSAAADGNRWNWHEPGTAATDGKSCESARARLRCHRWEPSANWHEPGPAATDGKVANRHEPGPCHRWEALELARARHRLPPMGSVS